MACRGFLLFITTYYKYKVLYIYVKNHINFMKLLLKNGITKRNFEYSVTDLNESSIYYTFNINLPEEMDEGEYNYTLKDDGDKILATGLLRVGDFKQNNTQYNNNKDNKYVQYGKK